MPILPAVPTSRCAEEHTHSETRRAPTEECAQASERGRGMLFADPRRDAPMLDQRLHPFEWRAASPARCGAVAFQPSKKVGATARPRIERRCSIFWPGSRQCPGWLRYRHRDPGVYRRAQAM